MFTLLITILVVLIIAALLYWAINYLSLPPELKKILTVVLVIGVVIFLIVKLLGARGIGIP